MLVAEDLLKRPIDAYRWSGASAKATAMIERLTVIGVGLIGGSLARALRSAKAVGEIVGCGRNPENLERAVALGVIDRYSIDPAAAVRNADMVVVAVTLGATGKVFQSIAGALRSDAIVTDVGSTKRTVVGAARAALRQSFPRFVPGHPIAGTEFSGVEASFAELFRDRRVILTPVAETEAAATKAVQTMWELTGARVVCLGVEHHDEVLAATSHLPHVLAYSLVDCLAGMSDSGEIFEFAAGGFRDFTRIASSNPEMWRDIALENREALLGACDRFEATLSTLRGALANKDGDALHKIFARAKRARDRYNATVPKQCPQ